MTAIDINGVDAVLLFGALIVLVYGPWQKICTDWGRQALFEKRDQLFDLAADGRLDFSAPEYRELRLRLELLIRFSHKITLARFLFTAGLLREKAASPLMPVEMVIAQIADPQTRQQVETLFLEAREVISMMLAVKSPLIMTITLLSLPLVLLWTLIRHPRLRACLDQIALWISAVVLADACQTA